MNASSASSTPLRPPPDLRPEESVDVRMVALMRCLLAFSALGIIYLDRTEPARLIELTYLSLALYCGYSTAIFLALLAGKPLAPRRTHHWVDVGFYAYLVGLTAGTSSIFFFFFFFAILVASFSEGFREGLSVTLVSVGMFVVVGLATSPGGAEFELDRALIRPIYLLIFGYMMAYWGGHETTLRRRLVLLKEVSSLANPRYGIHHLLAASLRRLLTFFRADCCVLVRSKGAPPQHLLYRVDASSVESEYAPQPLTAQAAEALLALPPSAAACYGERGRRWFGAAPSELAWDVASGEALQIGEADLRRLANLLEAPAFATVPYQQGEASAGRLFVGARRAFSRAEVEYLAQVVDQIAAAGVNLELLDELMENAAQLARSRISRDIHDTAIQPYIGLKLGLEALYRQLEGTGLPAIGRLQELVEMSRLAVDDLRSYIARLRSGLPGWPGEHLRSSLRGQLERYRKYYGIEVTLVAEPGAKINDRVAAEAYQIVSEAMSNVYRHTRAKRAFVELRSGGDWLTIKVGNERDAQSPEKPFTPRSISERAGVTGGRTEVKLDERGYDVLYVHLPLVIGYDSVPRGVKAR